MKRVLLPALCLLAASLPLSAQVVESNGVVVLEAENFSVNNSPRSGHDWTHGQSVPGFSGSGYMESLPNNTANLAAGATSPELQFAVTFQGSGVRYVWLRGHAATGNDDSAHVGLNGAGSAAFTLSQYDAWQWSNTLQGGAAGGSITVPSAGTHTVNLWMREDGLRIDRIILTTNAAFHAHTGNAWHIPSSAEPGGATMRSPFTPGAGAGVTIYNGSQFQGAGDPGNQTQTGSTVFYKKITDSAWSSAAMTFHSQAGNNKYYGGVIPAAALNPGDTIQYYLRVPFSDHLPTFLHGSDSLSQTSELEEVARASPFVFTVPWPLQPSGDHLEITSGAFAGRIHTGSGHIVLLQPDLNGTPLANAITFAPPSARIADRLYSLGPVVSSIPIPDGLELVQTLGGTTVTTRLTLNTGGVLTFEVVDWNGLVPSETLVTAGSDATEQFFGFGEKFNAVNQTGNRVRMLTWDPPGTKGDQSYKPVPWFSEQPGLRVPS